MNKAVRLALLFASFTAFGCASSDSAEIADAPAGDAAPAAESGATSECDLATAAARAAWRKQFDRVPDLAPEDRAAMADEHSTSSDAELGELEATANEAGDETMLEAIVVTRAAREVCER